MNKRTFVCGLTVLSFALLFFSGCATAPMAPAPLSPSLAANRIFVSGASYFPSSAVARELGAREQWDPSIQVWRLTAGSHELRLAPQMPVALLDGTSLTLPAPPVMDRGRLLLPERLWTDHLWQWRQAPALPAGPTGHLRMIVVDAGHGGQDPGARGWAGLKEKTITLDIAQRLRDLLQKDGFRVILTRSDDRFIPLYGRPAIANRAGADLFISIHANASRSRTADGFEAYYLSEATDDHARAVEASENADLSREVGAFVPAQTQAILWDLLYTEHRTESSELATHICRGMAGSNLASRSRGVKSARFAVLKGARMPAVLVEVGFITHPREGALLHRPEYRQRIADGIHHGILAFRDEMERKIAYAR